MLAVEECGGGRSHVVRLFVVAGVGLALIPR